MEEEEVEVGCEEAYSLIPNPLQCFTKLTLFQADLIYNSLTTFFSPISCLLSILHESYHRAEETKDIVESTIHKVPSTITHGRTFMLKMLSLGFLGAAYVCLVLMVVLVLAVVLGVGLLQLWVDQPVFVRESLYFDYTEPHPKAVFHFCNVGAERNNWMKKPMGVPIGHTFHVTLVLLMPKSDFNRDIRVFQLTAELLSVNGAVIAKSSQPCMLKFRSIPIRPARTFLMGFPLLIGISQETQMISIEMLKHKEGTRRTEAIRVTLVPRAGTLSPPQLYEAGILIHSQLPWTKQLVSNWKWTLYVWTFCGDRSERELMTEEPAEALTQARDEREVSELLRKWKRSKRKAIYLHEAMRETVGSSTSSMSVTREDTSTVVDEDTVDSESVCLGG
ncbi:hypothetical protein RGQ29_000185 [Quercus rubra]|uniref:Seipin n=1 Tax=Quercus rubra TaxID=3512 RepID=A0AAN7G523_QUERU|nr:hypothetical protein RGQ29_000185 [Quercus rubra]